MQFNLDEFVDILQLSISDNAEKVNEGLKIINLMKNDQLSDYLNLLIMVFTNDSVPDIVKHTAIVYFKNEITPLSSKTLAEIQKIWFDISETNRNIVKDFMLFLRTQEGLPFNFGCLLIATIYLIEQDSWKDLLPSLSSILASDCTPHDVHGIIRIYTEMFYLFPEIKLKKAAKLNENDFGQLIQTILSLLQNDSFDNLIKEEAALLLYKMMQTIPSSSLFNSKEHISAILDIFPQAMPIANEQCFETLYNIIYLIIDKYPTIIETERERIISYGISGFSCSTIDFLTIVLNFWSKIAKMNFARQLMEGNEDQIFAHFKTFMIPNEENDPEFLIPAAASDCLGQFSILYREDMFQNLAPEIVPMLKNSDWHNVYAGLLALRSLICIKDLYLIIQFVNENIQYIMELFHSENEKLAHLAISVSSELLNRYPKVGEETDGLIDFAIDFVTCSSDQNIEKFTDVLSFFSSVIRNSSIIYINSNFQRIFEITSSLVNAESIEDRTLQYHIFQVFIDLVTRTNEPSFMQNIFEQLSTFIESMITILQSEASENSFLRLQNICYAIKEIIHYLIIPDELQKILIDHLFTVMDSYPQLIDNDIFAIFSSIFISLKKNKGFQKFVEYAPSFIMFCRRALASQIPDLIGESAEAYSNMLLLFRSTYAYDYKDLIDEIINITVNIANPSFPIGYSKLMYSIGKCIAALGSSFPYEFINQIMDSIYQFIMTDLDSRNQNDIETFNEILPSILYAIKSIYMYYNIKENNFDSFVAFAKQNYIKIMLQKINKFNLYDPLILIGALRSLKAIIHSLKNSINIQLRTNPVNFLIQAAQSSDNQEVVRLAEEVDQLRLSA